MDSSRITIRPFSSADYVAEAEIDREIDPFMAITPEELEAGDRRAALEEGHLNLRLIATADETGIVAAYGSLGQPSFNYHPTKYWIWVAVRRRFRGRGLGSALFGLLESEARMRGATALWASVRADDPVAVRFVTGRHFQEKRRTWLSDLDLSRIDLSATSVLGAGRDLSGFRFTTLLEEEPHDSSVRSKIYELEQQVIRDQPHLGEPQRLSFEEYRALVFDHPAAYPEAFFLAFEGDHLVGFTYLTRDLERADVVKIGYTGTSATHRGRGVATELKRRAAEFAQRTGFRHLRTGNDSTNQPILAINRKFGFAAEVAWLSCERVMRPPDGAGPGTS